jgi:KDO2-lipid IV(A) lauroyltransferase
MASLGKVCAAGIVCNMAVALFLLPWWWLSCRLLTTRQTVNKPSNLYRAKFWRVGLWLARRLPYQCSLLLARTALALYWHLVRRRREIVISNLLPATDGNHLEAETAARRLYRNFAVKVTDLLRYEAGVTIEPVLGKATDWDLYVKARAQERGVLLITPHLGNWEFGAPFLTRQGEELQVITLAEPGRKFTELRQEARSRMNIKTIVIGEDPFAFLEIIRRLEGGATVALLIDRPPAASAVSVRLFGRDFSASIAAAELARASGCVLLPVFVPRSEGKYHAHLLPPIPYVRSELRDREARRQLTERILRAFEPVITAHLDQWYHFVPVWANNEGVHKSTVEQHP